MVLLRYMNYVFRLIFLVILVGAGVCLFSDLPTVMDVGLYDESIYLDDGARIPTRGLPRPSSQDHPAYAPLYALWYGGLALFSDDLLGVHYFNFQLLGCLVPVLCYCLLLSYGVGTAVSFLSGVVVLYSTANISLWPRVGSFTLCLIVIWFIALNAVKDRALRFASLASLLALLTYLRPDHLLGFGVAVALALTNLRLISAVALRLKVIYVLLLVGVPLLLWSLFGSPIQSDNRSFIAFGQNFSRQWVRWNALSLDPYADWARVMEEAFPGCRDIFCAIRTNPPMLLRHVAENSTEFPSAVAKVLGAPYPEYPDEPWTSPWELRRFLPLLLALGGCALAARPNLKKFRQRVHSMSFLLTSLAIISVPALVSAVLVAPNLSYLTAPVTVSFLMGVLLLTITCEVGSRNSLRSYAATVLVLPLMFFSPAISEASRVLPNWLRGAANMRTLNAIMAMPLCGQIRLLGIEGPYEIYARDRIRWVDALQKNGGFNEFLSDRKITAIVVSDQLSMNYRFAQDPEWKRFLEQFESRGFAKYPVLGTKRFLLVDKHLVGCEVPSQL